MADQKEIEIKRKALDTFFNQLADLFRALNKIAPQHSARLEKEGFKIQAAIKAGVQFHKIVNPFHAKVKEFYLKYDGFKGKTQEQIFQQVLLEGIILANELEGPNQNLGLTEIWSKLNPQTQKHLSGYFFVLVKCSVTLCGPVVPVAHQQSIVSPQQSVAHQRNVDQQPEQKDLQDIKHFVDRLNADAKSGKLHKELGAVLPDNKEMSKIASKLAGDIQSNNLPPHLQGAAQDSMNAIKRHREQEAKREAAAKAQGLPFVPKSDTEQFAEMAQMVIAQAMKSKQQQQPRPLRHDAIVH